LRVRWALEEAELPYEQRLLGLGEQKAADYRRLQPFGQVPVLEDDGLVLFESGAIVLHIAERSPALLPADPTLRARARAWVFAALNSIEPPLQHLAEIDLFNADQGWAKARRPAVLERVKARLGDLTAALGEREYLEGQFTAGDLLMTTVLHIVRHTDLLRSEFPALDAYRARCESRPAFARALAAQMAPFALNGPAAQSA
jgi:glutathione S-transferase